MIKYFVSNIFSSILLGGSAAEAQRGRGGEFNCTMIFDGRQQRQSSTDCAALTTGQRRYITGISWSSINHQHDHELL